ncbi:MAG TPA: toll/interleukin-1 receptor domain-containing protein [Thermoanaerobaculia bacterium]
MSEAYSYDVFISYSHADEQWVDKTLRPRLEDAGLKVCIDRNFLAGHAAFSNIEEAIKHSRHTVLVLTPNWINSPWTLLEGQLATKKHLTNPACRTVPVLLQPCEPPGILSILTYVDLTREDQAERAWAQLLDSLRVHHRNTSAPVMQDKLGGTTPITRSASRATPPRYPYWLFLLLAAVLALPWILLRPCAPVIIKAFGIALIALLWLHVLWRHLRPVIEAERGSPQFQKMLQRVDAVHVHRVPTSWLWVLALLLSVALATFFLLPVTLLKAPDLPPTVDGFRLVHHNGSEELIQIGGLAKIRAGESVLISVQLRSSGSPRCKWLKHRGRFENSSECETVYFAPADGAFDNLSILAKSRCQARDAFAGLTIKVVPVEP